MANPRQRRKARSSTHKAVSHSKHAKKQLKKMPPIRGPKILQDAWDDHKTVRQNYAALGLVSDLNPSASGGVEIIDNPNAPSSSSQVPVATTSITTAAAAIPKGHGRIIRDTAGNVLRIEFAEEDEEKAPSSDEDQDMEQLAPEVDPKVMDAWATNMGGGDKGNGIGGKGNVVEALERISEPLNLASTTLSATLSGVGPRHTSSGEFLYLERLIQKYGQDTEKMARDRKLNPEQRTAGELRRALKRAGLPSGS